MEEKPNYYAIIPASVRYDNNLTPSEKLFYGEITALTYKTGECWATNSYFANLYNVSTRSITSWIAHLEKNNYIQTETFYKENSKEIEKRVIKIPIENNFYTYGNKFLEGYRKKDLGGIEKNFQENNTSNNNTSINNKEIYKERFEIFYKAYPKHLKKAEVEKWFLKNKPDETLFKTIMTQLEKFKQTKEWSNTQYIPYPSTWLNQKRWEDQIETKEDRDKKLIEELKQWEVENGYRTS